MVGICWEGCKIAIDCSLCACTYPGIGVLDVVHDTVRISVHIQVNAPAWDLGATKCTSTGGGGGGGGDGVRWVGRREWRCVCV